MLTLRTHGLGDLDALVDSLWGSTLLDTTSRRPRSQAPEPQWRKDGDQVALSLAMPGLGIDDIEIEIQGRQLSVRATRELSRPEGFQPVLRERSSWTFHRSWGLPSALDADSLTAQLRDGVLTLRIQERQTEAPRRITIEHPTLIDTEEA